jgi:hypothetical protein
MYEHWEVWTWNGKDWNREEYKPRYEGEDPFDVESRARAFYAQQVISMPNCPAKLVWVRAEDEFYGKGR